jgi:hypothetical protein
MLKYFFDAKDNGEFRPGPEGLELPGCHRD